jgi:hypothetical protein
MGEPLIRRPAYMGEPLIQWAAYIAAYRGCGLYTARIPLKKITLPVCCALCSRSAISDHEVSVKRLFVSKQNGRARLCCLYCPRCEIKFGNPLKCSVELSQILICLLHGRSFCRGGAQSYAYLVGPTVGDFISRFDNSADAVRGAAWPVDEGKAVGMQPRQRLCRF